MLSQFVQRLPLERSYHAPSAVTFVRAISALNVAVVLLFADGTAAWTSPAALEILECEDQARVLRPALRRLAREVSVAERPGRPRVTRRSLEVRVRAGVYRLVAASLTGTPSEPCVAVTFRETRSTATVSIDALRELHRLTIQQARVAELLIQGHSNASIASHLGVKLSTARSHVEHVRRKLGVRSRAQVVARLVAEIEVHRAAL